ncbi:MAG: hypothetical protein ABIA63_09700 [bacterium]
MSVYKLRFVQRFKAEYEMEFMEVEREFAALEKRVPEFPKGKRYKPYSGREPNNTLVWECDFNSLEDAQKALEFLCSDQRHEELFKKQVRYFEEPYTEIYELLDF